jgi:hypothetical protein
MHSLKTCAIKLDALCETALPQINDLRTLEVHAFMCDRLEDDGPARNSFGIRVCQVRPSLQDLTFRILDDPTLDWWQWDHQHECFGARRRDRRIDHGAWGMALREVV